jgi:hypothetical protein
VFMHYFNLLSLSLPHLSWQLKFWHMMIYLPERLNEYKHY